VDRTGAGAVSDIPAFGWLESPAGVWLWKVGVGL
jgi:hypothetical protein